MRCESAGRGKYAHPRLGDCAAGALSSDAAHLLVPAIAVDFGLEADALGHGVRDGGAARGGALRRAEHLPDIDLAAFEEAASQDAVGGQAQAVAGGAEGGGHGADEANA